MKLAHEWMQQGINRGYFPSAVLLVSVRGQPVWHQAYGSATLDTVFDLASLTKPLATALSCMQLVDAKQFTLKSRLGSLLPAAANSPYAKTPLWQLLGHCSGLAAHYEYFKAMPRLRSAAQRKQWIRSRILQEPMAYRPGTKSVYSDLGYILLEWVIESVTHTSFETSTAANLYRPLKLSATQFVDLSRPGAAQALRKIWPVAATEFCPWRKKRLHAEVHDDNAWMMGGISGHAGLFSTAFDVHLLLREVVAAYHEQSSLLLAISPAVMKACLRPWDKTLSSWALGWDTPSGATSTSGRYFGPNSIGHLGFTGTSFWIDLDRQIAVVLLTNRVYNGRQPNPMPRFRPMLHDRVMRALVDR